MADILRAIGYPLSTIIVILIFGFFGKKIFVKILDQVFIDKQAVLESTIQERKDEFIRAIEERKAELGRETERLKTSLDIEAETYKLAAQKRFKQLLELWESSESLFGDTDFSKVESIKEALEKVDRSTEQLNRYSVLFLPSVDQEIRVYLEKVANVLTNSEKDFDENAITPEKISESLKSLAKTAGMVHPTISMAASIGAKLVKSGDKYLKGNRLKAARDARSHLEKILRQEFGVWESSEKPLRVNPPNQ